MSIALIQYLIGNSITEIPFESFNEEHKLSEPYYKRLIHIWHDNLLSVTLNFYAFIVSCQIEAQVAKQLHRKRPILSFGSRPYLAIVSVEYIAMP